MQVRVSLFKLYLKMLLLEAFNQSGEHDINELPEYVWVLSHVSDKCCFADNYSRQPYAFRVIRFSGTLSPVVVSTVRYTQP
jgi:hypothetical protein